MEKSYSVVKIRTADLQLLIAAILSVAAVEKQLALGPLAHPSLLLEITRLLTPLIILQLTLLYQILVTTRKARWQSLRHVGKSLNLSSLRKQ